MKAKHIIIFIFLSLLFSCCTRGIDHEDSEIVITGEDADALEVQAEIALTNFYTYLNQEKYDQAADLYGGSYEVLLGYNPKLSKGDKSELLRAACEFNGFMCLEILSAVLIDVNDLDELVFDVQFANPDGSEFVLGPCCGASEEEMPPVSTFPVHVLCEDEESCMVMDLPPYMP